MVFFLLIVLMLMFSSVKMAPANAFADAYMSKENTSCIKGIFVILIVFSHCTQYVMFDGVYDAPYLALKAHLGQMVVAMFWLYSGYGIMESISAKGFSYVKSIPTKRFLTVLINFDLAVILFLIVGACLGKFYDVPTFLLSLIGWKNVGNSNWYIFAVLVLYLLTFVSFVPIKKWIHKKFAHYLAATLLTLLTIAFVYWQMKMERPTYCYNTLILYPLGVWYSLLKQPIKTLIMRNDFTYALAIFGLLALYTVAFPRRSSHGIEMYSLWAIAFTLLVVAVTMKVTFENVFLSWFGKHVFSVYILQRIPMMIFQKMGLAVSHTYLFLLLSLAATVVLAIVFDHITGMFLKQFFSWFDKRKTEDTTC